ncbi:MAG: hypothetical protein K0R13_3163, partial [Propionibacteriaceae bacterium]|nr:hypothetical protein [Propionibacteriaceae bacterium]
MWRLYQLIPVVGLVILTLMRGGAGCFSPRSLSGPRKTSSALQVACLLSFEDFRCCQARGGRMPLQWVDVGARRLINGTALAPRSPTRRQACKC